VCLDPADVEFPLLTRESEIGLKLFIPGFSDTNKAMKQIAYLMLDEALGEYDIETEIGLIQMLPRESPASTRRYPLPDLPGVCDRLSFQFAKAGTPN